MLVQLIKILLLLLLGSLLLQHEVLCREIQWLEAWQLLVRIWLPDGQLLSVKIWLLAKGPCTALVILCCKLIVRRRRRRKAVGECALLQWWLGHWHVRQVSPRVGLRGKG